MRSAPLTSEVWLTDRMEWLSTFPDKYFDLILDDPEYGIGTAKMAFTREVNNTCLQKNGTRLKINKKAYTQKEWDSSGTPGQEYFDELCRVSSHQIIFGIDYFDWKGVGPGRIVWDKLRPKGLSFKPTETAYQSFDGNTHDIKCLWSGMMQAKSVEFPTIQQGNKKLNEKRIHPAQKPVILWKLLMLHFGVPKESFVGAPNCGSQSSRIACWDMKMHWEGCDRDAEYTIAGNEWFERHTGIVTKTTHGL